MRIGCLDPKLLLDPDPRGQEELWKSVARCCGWTRRKAIAEIPKNLSFGHHLRSGPEKLRLIERIRLAQGRLCLVDPPVVAPGKTWIDRAEATPWVTELVSDDSLPAGSKQRQTADSFWDLECENHRSCRWDDPVLMGELQVLLRKTRRIDVMDRYLVKEQAVLNLQRILGRIRTSGCMEVSRPELVLHCSPEDRMGPGFPATDEFLARCFRPLRQPPWQIRIMLWRKEGLHSRYLLADQGGLTIGESLTWPSGEPVSFTFMNDQAELRRKFSSHSDHGKSYLMKEVRLN